MQNDEPLINEHPGEAAQSPDLLPYVPGERRKQDRRQGERQGKYDRRRNRCMHCLHFQEEASPGKGHCKHHNLPMASYAFACPFFEPLQK